MGLVYQVVADVNQYKDFVPWCVDSVVHGAGVDLWQTRPFTFKATLDVGFRLIGERYTSVVNVVPLQRVQVRAACVCGPHGRVQLTRSRCYVQTRAVNTHLFEYLTNIWSFEPGPTPDTCWLTFNISFKFKNGLYAQVHTWPPWIIHARLHPVTPCYSACLVRPGCQRVFRGGGPEDGTSVRESVSRAPTSRLDRAGDTCWCH